MKSVLTLPSRVIRVPRFVTPGTMKSALPDPTGRAGRQCPWLAWPLLPLSLSLASGWRTGKPSVVGAGAGT